MTSLHSDAPTICTLQEKNDKFQGRVHGKRSLHIYTNPPVHAQCNASAEQLLSAAATHAANCVISLIILMGIYNMYEHDGGNESVLSTGRAPRARANLSRGSRLTWRKTHSPELAIMVGDRRSVLLWTLFGEVRTNISWRSEDY